MIWGRRGWEENELWEIDKQTTLASYTRRQTQSYSLWINKILQVCTSFVNSHSPSFHRTSAFPIFSSSSMLRYLFPIAVFGQVSSQKVFVSKAVYYAFH